MKKIVAYFLKLAVSGVLALVILSALTLVYYNPPISKAQPDKYTNSKFESNAFWSDMIEGWGFGTTNDLGYNDPDGFATSDPVIAVLGSSHTEALQVSQKKNYVSKLQEKLSGDSDKTNDISCLNLGVSGHFFDTSVSNFEYFAESFSNVRDAVIETGDLEFTPEQLEKMLNGEYHTDLGEKGLLYESVQKIPYARLLYKQYMDTKKVEGASSEKPDTDYPLYEEGMDKVLEKLSGIAAEKGFELTILYHNKVMVKNRNGFRTDDLQIVEIFQKCCEKNDVMFIDVTDSFVERFNATYELPYGFSNTTMGSGHLNELGHSIVADELYKHFAAQAEGN